MIITEKKYDHNDEQRIYFMNLVEDDEHLSSADDEFYEIFVV